MDTVTYWQVFENTGSIEAYLTYRKTEEASTIWSLDSEESEIKGFEGEK